MSLPLAKLSLRPAAWPFCASVALNEGSMRLALVSDAGIRAAAAGATR
eukprot:CAMPEP_0171178168 /NCGR_PEP_ID=MMETSP0790-20130122/12614_1 /TAXON_ID=2925 /ORGANISM="Alexandrium catenella, Strain OF101" /LENGTH=47 /DNA_ID= /DNA_START= /DNA_END= /DNA_ORIENTATION=